MRNIIQKTGTGSAFETALRCADPRKTINVTAKPSADQAITCSLVFEVSKNEAPPKRAHRNGSTMKTRSP